MSSLRPVSRLWRSVCEIQNFIHCSSFGRKAGSKAAARGVWLSSSGIGWSRMPCSRLQMMPAAATVSGIALDGTLSRLVVSTSSGVSLSKAGGTRAGSNLPAFVACCRASATAPSAWSNRSKCLVSHSRRPGLSTGPPRWRISS